MTEHYTKLWSQILESTLWHQDKDVILLWIVMLAKKDKDHIVRTPIPTLALLAKITPERCEECLKILNSPDKYSNTPDHEGRRIIPAEGGGWFLVNGQKYQDHLRQDQRRAAVAKATRDWRARRNGKRK